MTIEATASVPRPTTARRWPAQRWSSAVVAALAVAALVRLLGGANLAHATGLVRGAGWLLVTVLVPTGVALGLDARGWQIILRTVGHQVRWRTLVPLRIAVESLVLTVPGGGVAGEAMKASLLRRAGGVPLAAGTASLALVKACLMGGYALYMTAAAVAIIAAGDAVTLAPGLVAAGGALFVGAASLTLFLLLRNAAWASRGGRWLSRLPHQRLRHWAVARRDDFRHLDGIARGFFAAPSSTRLQCLALFVGEWLMEGLETWLILRCLGVRIGVAEVVALDGITSLLRALAFFVPAGVGVQEATQITLLRALGVSDPIATGAALIFVKRAKEVFWVFTGSLLWIGRSDRWRQPSTTQEG